MHPTRRALLASLVALALLGCPSDDPTGPPPLAQRYVLVRHDGQALPVVLGTVTRVNPRDGTSMVTCTNELMAMELTFLQVGGSREAAWTEARRTMCEGTPVEVVGQTVPGTAEGPAGDFRITFPDALGRTVLFVRLEDDGLVVYRQETWRGDAMQTVDLRPLTFEVVPLGSDRAPRSLLG